MFSKAARLAILFIYCGLCHTGFAEVSPKDSLITLHPVEGAMMDSVNVRFVWRKHPNCSRYGLQVSADSLFRSYQAGPINGDTTYAMTEQVAQEFGIYRGQKFYWRIFCGADDSGYMRSLRSTASSFTISSEDPGAPMVYQPKHFDIVDPFKVVIKWEPVKFATRYNIKVTRSKEVVADAVVEDTLFTILLLPKGLYQLTVASIDSEANYHWSTKTVFETDKILNGKPLLLTPGDSTIVTPSNCLFRWKPNVNIKGPFTQWISVFKAEGELRSINPPILDTQIVDDSMFVYSLEPNKKYYWSVTSGSGGELQNPSDLVSSIFIFYTDAEAKVSFEEGGKRLFNPEGEVTITRISPNPASESVQVEIETIEAGRTQVVVMDVLGRAIATLYDGEITSGTHKLQLNTSNIAAGSYYLSPVTPTVKKFARVDILN